MRLDVYLDTACPTGEKISTISECEAAAVKLGLPQRFFFQVEPDYNRVDTVKRRQAARNFLSDFEWFSLWDGLE